MAPMSSPAKTSREELTTEEIDMLQRSNKKVKATTGSQPTTDQSNESLISPQAWKVSSKDTLLGHQENEAKASTEQFDDEDWDME